MQMGIILLGGRDIQRYSSVDGAVDCGYAAAYFSTTSDAWVSGVYYDSAGRHYYNALKSDWFEPYSPDKYSLFFRCLHSARYRIQLTSCSRGGGYYGQGYAKLQLNGADVFSTENIRPTPAYVYCGIIINSHILDIDAGDELVVFARRESSTSVTEVIGTIDIVKI